MEKRYQKKKISNKKIVVWCWVFLSPMLLLFLFFQVYPILSNIRYSLLDWTGMSAEAVFVGLDNYKELVMDKYFWNALGNSFQYMLMCVPVQLFVSLLLAYLLNSVLKKGVVFFRTIFFLPVITTTVIIGIVMVFIFGGTGVLNQLLSSVGIPAVNWIGNPKTSLWTLAGIGVWKDVGVYMIYWMVALQSISGEVYEAAKMDGANGVSIFKSIVLPMVMPMGGVIATLCVINYLKVFDLVLSMTGGGPFYATDVVATFVYRTAYSGAFGMPRVGYASAASMMFGIIAIAIGITANQMKHRLQNKSSI